MHKLQRKSKQSQQPPRSKSSDILKNNHSSSTHNHNATGDFSAGKSSQTFSFNSLKQWGKNRLRMKVRSMAEGQQGPIPMDQQLAALSALTVANNNADDFGFAKKASDIDDFNVHDSMRRNNTSSGSKRATTDRALSHERKPSYSSSERSLPLSISSQATSAATTSPTLPASINPVKMRESASIRRQRRLGLGYKEEPNN